MFSMVILDNFTNKLSIPALNQIGWRVGKTKKNALLFWLVLMVMELKN